MHVLGRCAIVVPVVAVQSLGFTLQRLSRLDPPLPASGVWPTPDQRKHSVWLWRAGIGMFAGAAVGSLALQLLLLPPAIICYLQATALIANAAFAALFLKELPTKATLVGSLLIIIGVISECVYGGPWIEPDLTLDEVLGLLCGVKFAAYALGTFAIIGALVSRQLALYPDEFRFRLRDTETAREHDQPSRMLPSIASSAQWATCAGIAGAHALFLAKLAIRLLVRDGADLILDLERMQFWLLLVVAQVLFIVQIWCISKGLKPARTYRFLPIVFAVYVGVEFVDSRVLLGGPLNIWATLGSMALLLSGVALLSMRFAGPDDATPWRLLSILGLNPSETEETVLGLSARGLPNVALPNVTLPNLTLPNVALPNFTLPSAILPNARLGSPRNDGPRPKATNSPSDISIRAASPGLATAPMTPISPHAPSFFRTPSSSSDLPLINTATYTSFDSISPNISNPDKVRGRHNRVVLSKEQHKILRELGI